MRHLHLKVQDKHMIDSYTIGFTKKPARDFFAKLQLVGVRKLLDVRLNNNSQLAGFAKRDDLKFFLKSIASIEYEHVIELAPTKEMLDTYKKHGGHWDVYKQEFLELMTKRSIETQIPRTLFDGSCLLCSEHLPQHCHRRLVLEYLQEHWGEIRVTHIT